ncbi:MAG: type VI secretion system baseplate subunit TssK [Gemmatimonadaceae bacterium]
MKQLTHVVWNEGMHLAQHHFQAQSRFFEDSVQFALTSLFFKPYGLVACELNAEALQNDTVALVHARGIMPDGLPFDIPGGDPALSTMAIRDRFSPTADGHLILLAVPAYRPDASNVAMSGAVATFESSMSPARYTADSVIVRDAITGRDERPLGVARKNFRLVLDGDATGADLSGLVTLPIARVKRDGAGHFMLDSEYIPPSLQIGASSRLMSLVTRLTEMLDAKAETLTHGRRGSSDEFAQREVASFWLLHAIQASVPTLRHYAQAKHIHPERLYVELARLAGSLCTFALDTHPRTLPLYDHDQPQASFDALDRHIRSHFDVVAPPARTAMPLVPSGQSLYSASIKDPRSFGPARWIIGIRSSLPASELAAHFPVLARVCSAKFVMELVKRGFPGLTVTHVPYPPPSIAPQSDMQYFEVTRAGPCWDTIMSTQQIGVYVPDGVLNPELELSVVMEGEG